MKRVQMRRGVKLPPNTRYVGRGSRWGNPFRIGRRLITHEKQPDGMWVEHTGEPLTREQAVERYRLMVRSFGPTYRRVDLAPLRGFDLACWCPLDGQPCHADVLLELLADG